MRRKLRTPEELFLSFFSSMLLVLWPWSQLTETEFSAEDTEWIILTVILNETEIVNIFEKTNLLVDPLVLLFLTEFVPRNVVQMHFHENLTNPWLRILLG